MGQDFEPTGRPDDRADVEQAVASCGRSHAALVAHLRSLDGSSGESIDPTAPSRLPDWTIGHVLTHIARNGDSHLDMLAGRPQYPSVEARNLDIDAGARRPWVELVDDVARACVAVDTAFAEVDDWSGTARTVGGERPTTLLPLLRQREVEVHRVDLGLGYDIGDLPADYVRRDLQLMEMLWTARKPMGMTALPDAALAADPATRLAWMMGRIDLPGLEPAGLF